MVAAKKIAFIGSHSVRKTNAVHSFAGAVGRSGRSVEVYQFPQLLDERVAGSTLLRRAERECNPRGATVGDHGADPAGA